MTIESRPVMRMTCLRRRTNSAIGIKAFLISRSLPPAGRRLRNDTRARGSMARRVAGGARELVVQQQHADPHVLDHLDVGLLVLVAAGLLLEARRGDPREVAEDLGRLAREALRERRARETEAAEEAAAPVDERYRTLRHRLAVVGQQQVERELGVLQVGRAVREQAVEELARRRVAERLVDLLERERGE